MDIRPKDLEAIHGNQMIIHFCNLVLCFNENYEMLDSVFNLYVPDAYLHKVFNPP